MPISTNATEELKIANELFEKDKALYNRMDRDWGKFRGDQFIIPSEEGEFESVTSNRAQSEGWKIINVLGMADRKIYMLNRDAKEAEREDISDTEVLAQGLLYTAERRWDSDPMLSATIQMNMAFYAVVRGWRAYRVLVMEDDDGLSYLDLAIWDPRHVSFIAGNGRYLKVYNECFRTKEEVKDDYPDFNGDVDPVTKLVRLVEAWDVSEKGKPAEQAVIFNSEYIKDPEKVKVGGIPLEYFPGRIKPCGGVPLISDGKTDNIAHVGESYLVNNRELLDVESRILSYDLTSAGMEAHPPIIINFNSKLDTKPPKLPNDPRTKDSVIFLDEGKGQKQGEPLNIPRGDKINAMYQLTERMLNRGGLSSIAHGEVYESMTATGMSILNQNTREQLFPFKQALESDFAWLATEITNQFAKGSFQESDFKYYSTKQKAYESRKLAPGKVKTDGEFRCELNIESLRDRAVQIDMATKEIQAGLNSRRGAMDTHQLSEDPDQTMKEMSQERMATVAGFGEIDSLEAMCEDYLGKKVIGDLDWEKLYKENPFKALKIELAFQQIENMRNQIQLQRTGGGQGNIAPPENNGNRTAALNARIPQENLPRGMGEQEIPPEVRRAVMKSTGMG